MPSAYFFYFNLKIVPFSYSFLFFFFELNERKYFMCTFFLLFSYILWAVHSSYLAGPSLLSLFLLLLLLLPLSNLSFGNRYVYWCWFLLLRFIIFYYLFSLDLERKQKKMSRALFIVFFFFVRLCRSLFI